MRAIVFKFILAVWLDSAFVVQVRTQTLVKNAIVLVDATPFKQYYLQHYGIELGTKKKVAAGVMDVEQKEKEELQSHSRHVNRKHQQRAKGHKPESAVSFHIPFLLPSHTTHCPGNRPGMRGMRARNNRF